MLLGKERELVCEYSLKAMKNGLTKGTGGNISIADRASGLFALTPSGLEYEVMRPEDVVVLDLNGTVVDGALTPSSELGMHIECYRKRGDVNAVVHTHSLYACTLACMGWKIEPVHYLLGYAGVVVNVAPYHRFGTAELAKTAVEVMGDNHAVLLGNHGLLSVGASIEYAYNVAEETEFVAGIYYRCRIAGEPILIPEDEMRDMVPIFQTYGQKKLR